MPSMSTDAWLETGNSGFVMLVGFENAGRSRSTRASSGATARPAGGGGCGIRAGGAGVGDGSGDGAWLPAGVAAGGGAVGAGATGDGVAAAGAGSEVVGGGGVGVALLQATARLASATRTQGGLAWRRLVVRCMTASVRGADGQASLARDP
jgi:hypothetical protein